MKPLNLPESCVVRKKAPSRIYNLPEIIGFGIKAEVIAIHKHFRAIQVGERSIDCHVQKFLILT
jgi:hypothetical protein